MECVGRAVAIFGTTKTNDVDLQDNSQSGGTRMPFHGDEGGDQFLVALVMCALGLRVLYHRDFFHKSSNKFVKAFEAIPRSFSPMNAMLYLLSQLRSFALIEALII